MDRVNCLKRQAAPFAVHFMIADIVNLDRQKGSRPDMQGDFCKIYPGGEQPVPQPVCEMQARGRCGHRPRHEWQTWSGSRVYRLRLPRQDAGYRAAMASGHAGPDRRSAPHQTH